MIRSHTRVIQLAVRSGRIDGVLTEDGPVPADAVVLATGPWMNELLRDVELAGEWLRLPMGAGRGWLLGISQLPVAVPWIIEEISWPDQEVLGTVTRLRTLAEVAAGIHEQPAVEAFVLAPVVDGGAALGAALPPAPRRAVGGVDTPPRPARRALGPAPRPRPAEVAAAS